MNLGTWEFESRRVGEAGAEWTEGRIPLLRRNRRKKTAPNNRCSGRLNESAGGELGAGWPDLLFELLLNFLLLLDGLVGIFLACRFIGRDGGRGKGGGLVEIVHVQARAGRDNRGDSDGEDDFVLGTTGSLVLLLRFGL
jgi:hypothetical protein